MSLFAAPAPGTSAERVGLVKVDQMEREEKKGASQRVAQEKEPSLFTHIFAAPTLPPEGTKTMTVRVKNKGASITIWGSHDKETDPLRLMVSVPSSLSPENVARSLALAIYRGLWQKINPLKDPPALKADGTLEVEPKVYLPVFIADGTYEVDPKDKGKIIKEKDGPQAVVGVTPPILLEKSNFNCSSLIQAIPEELELEVPESVQPKEVQKTTPAQPKEVQKTTSAANTQPSAVPLLQPPPTPPQPKENCFSKFFHSISQCLSTAWSGFMAFFKKLLGL